MGRFYTGLAITDVFLVKSLVTGVGKVAVKVGVKLFAKEVAAEGVELAAKELTGGAARAAGRNWQTASLKTAIERHAGSNYTSWTTTTGKQIFENPATGRQVVVDLEGGYFRIYQPKSGSNPATYLNMMGREVTPARMMSNGSVGNPLLRDVDKGLWQQETHFFIQGLSK